jgi:anti-sigma factor RsiW
MRCEESRQLIDFYLDGELDALRSAEFELHARGCSECTPQIERAGKLRSAIRESAPYFAAPAALKLRIRDALRFEAGVGGAESAPRLKISYWRLAGAVAASIAAALVLIFTLRGHFTETYDEDDVADQVVASHVRSLMASHLTDVTSSDRHTVKPWFDGKIDFAPNVPDFSAEGFPLTGGRLDYINRRPVAALVYQRRLHYINVFIWPANSSITTRAKTETREGYNILHWQYSGMDYWCISDTSPDDLQALAKLLQQ